MVETFRQLFDMLAETTAARTGANMTAQSAKTEIWLPLVDSYRTMCLAPAPEFKRVLEAIASSPVVRLELAQLQIG